MTFYDRSSSPVQFTEVYDDIEPISTVPNYKPYTNSFNLKRYAKDYFKWSSSKLSHMRLIGGFPSIFIHSARPSIRKEPCQYVLAATTENIMITSYFIFFALGMLTLFDWLLVAGMAVLTWVCYDTGYTYSLGDSGHFLGIVIFPLTFAIGSAYTRESNAISAFYGIAGAIGSMADAFRNFTQGTLPCADVISKVFAIKKLLLSEVRNYADAKFEPERLERISNVGALTGHLDWCVIELRRRQLHPAYVNQLDNAVGNIGGSFGRLRSIVEYRTPLPIQAFLFVGLIITILGFAPAYADVGIKTHGVFAFLLSSLTAVMLLILYRTHQKFEMPFGKDTSDINVEAILGVPVHVSTEEHQQKRRSYKIPSKIMKTYGHSMRGFETFLYENVEPDRDDTSDIYPSFDGVILSHVGPPPENYMPPHEPYGIYGLNQTEYWS